MSTRVESHARDAAVAEELKAHHAVMVKDLGRLRADLADAAAAGRDTARARKSLEEWIKAVLVPHAEEEEGTTYRAAGELSAGKLLIASMLAEHVLIRQTAGRMSAAEDAVEAGTYGRVLFDIFDSHQRKENDIILPLLVDSDTVSLTEVVSGSHEHSHGAQSHAH